MFVELTEDLLFEFRQDLVFDEDGDSRVEVQNRHLVGIDHLRYVIIERIGSSREVCDFPIQLLRFRLRSRFAGDHVPLDPFEIPELLVPLGEVRFGELIPRAVSVINTPLVQGEHDILEDPHHTFFALQNGYRRSPVGNSIQVVERGDEPIESLFQTLEELLEILRGFGIEETPLSAQDLAQEPQLDEMRDRPIDERAIDLRPMVDLENIRCSVLEEIEVDPARLVAQSDFREDSYRLLGRYVRIFHDCNRILQYFEYIWIPSECKIFVEAAFGYRKLQ